MRFDYVSFAGFDMFVLGRPGAAEDHPDDVIEAARSRAASWGALEQQVMIDTITKGLPGAVQTLSFDAFKSLLASYAGIDAQQLQSNLHAFLEMVVPTADRLGMRLCCHPDDPPFPLLGLPRIVSSEADYARMLSAVDSPANGVTLCTGSLRANPNVDLPGMIRRLGPKVHFLHLRNVMREQTRFPVTLKAASTRFSTFPILCPPSWPPDLTSWQ